MVKFDAIAELTPTNAGARQMFEAMLAHIPEDDGKVNNVNPERIFVSLSLGLTFLPIRL